MSCKKAVSEDLCEGAMNPTKLFFSLLLSACVYSQCLPFTHLVEGCFILFSSKVPKNNLNYQQTWRKLQAVQAALADICQKLRYFEDILSQISCTFY